MGVDPKRRREIKKEAVAEAKERAKATNAANRKEARKIKDFPAPRARSAGYSAGAGPHIVNIYGDHVQVQGDGNQVAVGIGGDVHQRGAENAVDLDALVRLVRDLTATVAHIDFGDAEAAEEVRTLADDITAEASASAPDHGRLRRLAVSIGQRLQTVPTTAIGGFIAQGLAAAFLPIG